MTEDRDADEALAILRAALEVSRRIDLDAAAGAFVRQAASFTGLGLALLYLYDPESDVFRLRASTLSGAEPPTDASMAALDLASLRGSGPPDRWPTAVVPVPGPLRALGCDPVVAAPLVDSGRLAGLLLLGEPGRAPDGAAAEGARRLVPEMLPGLLNARQVEAFRELVIKDDQSECYNRRYFDRFLSEEVYRAQRYGAVLSLVFLDLDNLKEVNARYGHAVGSKTVREVARRLVAAIRGSDRAFRYGGDEFCIVLPATDVVGARDLCERLRRAFAERPFVVDIATRVSVTASFGIAAYPDHARTSMGLIKCSDEAMQRAKAAGKNTVCVAGLPEAASRVREGGR